MPSVKAQEPYLPLTLAQSVVQRSQAAQAKDSSAKALPVSGYTSRMHM